MDTETRVKQLVATLIPRLDAVLVGSGYRRVTHLDCGAGPAQGELGEKEPEAVRLRLEFSFVPDESEVLVVLS